MPRYCVLAMMLFGSILSTSQAQPQIEPPPFDVSNTVSQGMGSAGVAYAHHAGVFTHNPAQASALPLVRPQVRMFGYGTSIGPGVFDHATYLRRDLEPVFDQGISQMSEEERLDLYGRAFALDDRSSALDIDAVLPSFLARVAGISFGGAVMAYSTADYRFQNQGDGIPDLELRGWADVSGDIVLGVDLSHYGLLPVQLGASIHHVRRMVTVKNKSLGAMLQPEHLYAYRNSTTSFDVGLLYSRYSVALKGFLRFGMAVQNVYTASSKYAYHTAIKGRMTTDPSKQGSEILGLHESFGLYQTIRAGFAYEHTLRPRYSGFGDTVLTFDVVRRDYYSGTSYDIATGAQTSLMRFLALRVGWGSGQPAFGVGVKLGFVTLDYASFGVYDWSFDGPSVRRHRFQLTLSTY